MNITLKNGAVITAENGINLYEIAGLISEGLQRNAVVAKVDGELEDLSTCVKSDCQVEFFTLKDAEGMDVYRHTCAHVLAQAVKNIFPSTLLAIGPAIKNGFYYDFDFASPITKEDLPKIEKEMESIIKANFIIEKNVVKKKDATLIMRGFDEAYKLQLLQELPRGTKITFYKQGNFVDLCKGPHMYSTGKIKSFKLTHIAGAYWKGSDKNKMLTRIYGTCFEKKSELVAHLEKLEDAKRRDHNKLGRELNIFMTDESVGQGLPLLMPKGAKLLQILQRFVEDEEESRGYQLTRTPIMSKNDLFKVSGHWDHYKDGMFVMGDENKDDEVLTLRPMTCPFQFLIYKNGIKSYRDLPARYNETSTLFRNENSGEMHGLIRVRQFTLSDAHIVCTPSQVEDEFKAILDLIVYIMKSIGLDNDISYRFSKWDPKNKAKYIDKPEAWNETQSLMKDILDDIGLNYVEADGEAAFYGPKLDLQICNVWGKEDTLFTIQIDFALAERFDMSYIDENGEKQRPTVIHRSSIGCYERTIAMLIEKYAGAFPLWMAPEQVRLISLTDRTAENVLDAEKVMKRCGIRVSTDLRKEKVGYKIREATLEKIPYMVIIGDRDVENSVVSVRERASGDVKSMTLDEFIQLIRYESDNKIIK